MTPTSVDQSILADCRAQADRWAPLLRALGHPERLLIVLWLANNSCSVRQLQDVTGLRQSLVSYHLRELARAGLVTAQPVGRSNQYRLASHDLDEITALLGSLPPAGEAERSGPSKPG